jgi:pyruvate-formate lyase-activating enzyme
MRQLKLADVERSRNTPGQSVLLFLTDRCPVGCAHCSVDSRRDSPTITDFALFEELLAGICAQPAIRTVGISGGEPFVERRGLVMATQRIVAAGKSIVPYTSGVWANTTIPIWIRQVLRQASCVVLSTDAFHAGTVNDDRFVHAAQAIVEEGAWLVVQVLEMPDMVQRAERLLQRAFGAEIAHYAEINRIPPLPYGRGAALFSAHGGRPGAGFGNCGVVNAPVVRYDGRLAACCNEQVIVGRGPERLHQRCHSAAEVGEILARWDADPLLTVIAGAGLGALTQHPRFADLAQQRFSTICQLCWTINTRALPVADQSDHLLNALALLGKGRHGERAG